MNKEEAIKLFKKPQKTDLIEIIRKFKREGIENFIITRPEYVETLINEIKKQQKEIEEFKDKYSDEKIRNTVIKRYREVIEKDYVSKDKIKAKIEEVKDGTFDAKIVLQSLLEKE